MRWSSARVAHRSTLRPRISDISPLAMAPLRQCSTGDPGHGPLPVSVPDSRGCTSSSPTSGPTGPREVPGVEPETARADHSTPASGQTGAQGRTGRRGARREGKVYVRSPLVPTGIRRSRRFGHPGSSLFRDERVRPVVPGRPGSQTSVPTDPSSSRREARGGRGLGVACRWYSSVPVGRPPSSESGIRGGRSTGNCIEGPSSSTGQVSNQCNSSNPSRSLLGPGVELRRGGVRHGVRPDVTGGGGRRPGRETRVNLRGVHHDRPLRVGQSVRHGGRLGCPGEVPGGLRSAKTDQSGADVGRRR